MNIQPIGIFDSGVGGLTVARAVADALPGYPMVYFGDTAHLPYGEKSPELIQRYARRITEELLSMGCGSIVIACNSASSNALGVVQSMAGPHVPVIDVVHPVIDEVSSRFAQGRIGVIGTRATVSSGWYQQLLADRGFDVIAKATPLLASAIEEGFHEGRVSSALIEAYLGDDAFESLDALILGCTHYPLIRDQIAAQLPPRVALMDSAAAVARALKSTLADSGSMEANDAPGHRRFLVSDLTQSFALGAQRFFGSSIQLEHRPLPMVTP